MAVLGAIAQLGERLICIQEVRGSIPRSSTNSYLLSGVRVRKFLMARRFLE